MNNITETNYTESTFDAVTTQVNIKYFDNRVVLSKYNLLYLNINSLKNKIEELELRIIELNNKQKNKTIHFIALCEIRIGEHDTKYYNLNNYRAFYCTRNCGNGGCALFVHSSLICSLDRYESHLNTEILSVNILSLGVKIAVVYKQP